MPEPVAEPVLLLLIAADDDIKMFVRMRGEVLGALGADAQGTALVIALALAFVSVLANMLVVAIHALDGSEQVARLEALSTAVDAPLAQAHRLREKAASLSQQVAARNREAHRLAVQAITEAGHRETAIEQVIDTARAIHQRTSSHSGPTEDPNKHNGVVGYRDPQNSPQPDLRPIRTSRDHLGTDLPES